MIPILAFLIPFHAIYISVTEIDFVPETNKLNISVKIFTNDLEDGIYYLTKSSVSLRSPDQITEHSSLINQYISQRMEVRLNGQEVILKLISSANEGDATWTYFEAQSIDKISSLELRNQILTELFETQTNVVTVNINDDKRFLRFSKGSESELLKF